MTDTVIDIFPVGKIPSGVAVSPDGSLAYLTETANTGAAGTPRWA
jgi:DNA-binding beta-propeller fold protein YncE